MGDAKHLSDEGYSLGEHPQMGGKNEPSLGAEISDGVVDIVGGPRSGAALVPSSGG
jgi:hypothetical protein